MSCSSLTVTSILTSSVTGVTTTTVTTTDISTTVTTLTSTVISTTFISRPTCTAPNSNVQGLGGCSSNCYCDASTDGETLCTTNDVCRAPCTTSQDCNPNEFCTSNPVIVLNCGSSICESTDGCTTSATTKRNVKDVFGGREHAASAKFRRIAEIRAKWVHKRSVKLPNCIHHVGNSCDD